MFVLAACDSPDTALGPKALAPEPAPVAPPAPAPPPSDAEPVEDTTAAQTLAATIAFSRVRLDRTGSLLAAYEGASPYAGVAGRAWSLALRAPVIANGYPSYYTHAIFRGDPGHELEPPPDDRYPHNRAGLAAMWIDSALAWLVYSGDPAMIDQARGFADFELENGMTLPTDSWASVAYANANGDDVHAHGATYCPDGEPLCGVGDGDGIIETDKVAEFGLAMWKLHVATGIDRYRVAAESAAKALAAHVRDGDATHSPWPFRVDAATGAKIVEEYTANVMPAIALFDALGAYPDARRTAWNWLVAYPLANDAWSGYFEDIPVAESPTSNPNQYVALETARYLLEHREIDPDWRAHVDRILAWVTKVFAADGPERSQQYDGHQYGAEAISEQGMYPQKMGSHTARFASVLSLYHEKTGDASARARAFRSFNWATYVESPNGIVADTPLPTAAGIAGWFSDGYGDYIRHFLAGLGSVPAWAPANEDHLLRSSSGLRAVGYMPGQIQWTALDAGEDVLRLSAAPKDIRMGDQTLAFDMRAVANGGVIVRVRRASGGDVILRMR